MKRLLFFIFVFQISQYACTKKENPDLTPNLAFEFRFSATQARLDNRGQNSLIKVGNAAQSPEFLSMGVHYIELAQDENTLLGKGAIVYNAPETTLGGANAIDFEKLTRTGDRQEFQRISLKNVPSGTYNWIRTSVAYQNFDLKFNLLEIPVIGNLFNQTGTVSSFIGFNTYIKTVTPRSKELLVNSNRKQGFWAFESNFTGAYEGYNKILFGQAPAGSTTVVNPLFNTSPVPAGSCVVTGKLAEPLVITGDEKDDITVVLSFSVNKSLEWVDDNDNGQLDFYANPAKPNEEIVDMGIRGLIPSVKK